MGKMEVDGHLKDHDLILHADGELEAGRAEPVREHLSACWSCRARLDEIESAMNEFAKAHQAELNAALPPAEGPRALLKARLAELAPAQQSFFGHRMAIALSSGNHFFYAGAVFMALTVALLGWGIYRDQQYLAEIEPNRSLTPGATMTISEAELCSGQTPERVELVPVAMGREVFARYGIHDPGIKRYELDLLIAPELGGAVAPENFWPQPYSAPGWNAHVKDALEDRLHQLVCEQKVSLATAQQEIAADWISAYKKYFETDKPIRSHGMFLKDQPWEP